jgi:hypothetical protein
MGQLDPNPFFEYPGGDWETAMRPKAIAAVQEALARHRVGLITRQELWGDKNEDGIKYWLWFMHHKDGNRWKNLGRPYWSIIAYTTWRRYYFAVPPDRRLAADGGAHVETLQKRTLAGRDGLYHEHVVPQKTSFELIMKGVPVAEVLGRNIGAVITVGENSALRSDCPDPTDPWLRYKGSGIQFIENPKWTKAQRDALIRYDLLWTLPIPPFDSR